MVVLVLLLPAMLLCALLAMQLVEARLEAERQAVRVENLLDLQGSPFLDDAIPR